MPADDGRPTADKRGVRAGAGRLGGLCLLVPARFAWSLKRICCFGQDFFHYLFAQAAERTLSNVKRSILSADASQK